ncbi:hypothetical protein CYY_001342 [Polysphondylium violaceum]|uniref:Carbohydrate binding domain-containing protein n=1 Tax=Polysphondylium violaceum TaxID=133409 RepID=A0A8J4VAN6_9MYCE|nr:hypothetical protein CYY_001342 [Polysphondylium violaceum]
MYRSIFLIALVVLASAFAFSECPVTNRCERVSSWIENGERLSRYSCFLKNVGPDEVANVAMTLSGAKIKEIWEIVTSDKGKSWNLPEWRKTTPIQTGDENSVHSWGYVAYGDQALKVEICNEVKQYIERIQAVIINDHTAPQCNLSNKCTLTNQWKQDGKVHTQFNCEIKNIGPKAISHADIRLNDNQDLYNVWEIRTLNNGLSYDLTNWREMKPLESGDSHFWGYIVKAEEALNVVVCESGFVETQSPSPLNTYPSTTTSGGQQHSPQKCNATFEQKVVNTFIKDYVKYSQVEVTIKNSGQSSLSSVIVFSDAKFNSSWGIKQVDPINAPGNYQVLRNPKGLDVGSDEKFGYIFISNDGKAAPMNLISNAC